MCSNMDFLREVGARIEKSTVRFNNGLLGRLAESARQNSRSTTAEINARLEASFTEEVDVPKWTPVEGMLVWYNGDVAVIRGFILEGVNVKINIEVLGWSTFAVYAKELKPYLV